jgi:hypothetical protein
MSAREKLLIGLLKEAIKIIHCHVRNLEKDWLARARSAIRMEGSHDLRN